MRWGKRLHTYTEYNLLISKTTVSKIFGQSLALTSSK